MHRPPTTDPVQPLSFHTVALLTDAPRRACYQSTDFSQSGSTYGLYATRRSSTVHAHRWTSCPPLHVAGCSSEFVLVVVGRLLAVCGLGVLHVASKLTRIGRRSRSRSGSRHRSGLCLQAADHLCRVLELRNGIEYLRVERVEARVSHVRAVARATQMYMYMCMCRPAHLWLKARLHLAH